MPSTILLPSQAARDASTGTFDHPYVSLAGWGLSGVFIRSWALAMQHKPLLHRPHMHALFALSFAGLGYCVDKIENAALSKLEAQRDRLVKRRMLRLAAAGEQ